MAHRHSRIDSVSTVVSDNAAFVVVVVAAVVFRIVATSVSDDCCT